MSVFLALIEQFQILKNWKLKGKSQWVGIGGLRSFCCSGIPELDWDLTCSQMKGPMLVQMWGLQ